MSDRPTVSYDDMLDKFSEMLAASEARVIAAIRSGPADRTVLYRRLVDTIIASGNADGGFTPASILIDAEQDNELADILKALHVRDARRLGAIFRSIARTDRRLKRDPEDRSWSICT